LATGLVYTRLRSDFVAVMGGYPMTTEQTLHYLGVPLNAQYRLWGYKGLKVYGVAGVAADYNIKSQQEMEGLTQEISRDRWQFSLKGGLGVEYDVIPQLGIYVEPGLKYYFDNGSRVQNFFKDKPTNFNLQVGFRWNLR
jgi:opacity protein-like surface antigen